MGHHTLSVFCILAVAVLGCYSSSFQPSVAFVCDMGAMHMHEDGKWVSDPKTDCIESKSEILAYCKKVYPALEVTNIVESSEYKHIKGWCNLGKKTCTSNEAFTVRPYRCLTGPFQSDALIVPKKCEFDHVHQPKQCHGFAWWKDVAFKACQGLKHMKVESYAMLLPCGTDLFTGVEYVCCPDANATASADIDAKESTTSSVKVVPSVNVAGGLKESVNKYINMKQSSYKNTEHLAYEAAKSELIKEDREKAGKLMKEWEDSRKRVKDLKKIDSKGAEKANVEITRRFEKEYFAMQTASDAKLQQLDAVHQQHVQTNLDAKKRKSIEKLMQELQSTQPNERKLMKELKRYISTEEKDAHHCIQHYKKIRDRDGAQGQQLLPATISHLSLISKRINQSIGLLDALADASVKEKLVKETNDWRSKKFNSIDMYISTFKKELAIHHVVKKVDPTTPEPKKPTSTSKPEVLEMAKKPVITVKETKSQPETLSVKPSYKQMAEKYAAATGNSKLVKPKAIFTLDEENAKELEHAPKVKIAVSHLAGSAGVVVQPNVAAVASGSQSVASNLSVGAVVAIALGTVAAIFVVIFSVVVAKSKRKGVSKPAKDVYSEVSVEDNLSVEEKHIASMQNGYENPTYKLLETRAV